MFYSWWDFIFSRRRVWRLLSSGVLDRVVSLKLTDVLEMLAASIFRAMSKPRTKKWFKIYLKCFLALGLLIDLMIKAARTSETSVNVYQTTRRNIPEDSKLHTRRREKLKSDIFKDRLFNMLSFPTRIKKYFRIPRYYSSLHGRSGKHCSRHFFVKCANFTVQVGDSLTEN
jgi:hypothetical protein